MEKNELKLMDWIKNHFGSVEFFAKRLKIDKSYVYKISKGHAVPSKKIINKIKKITNGEFSEANDLIE